MAQLATATLAPELDRDDQVSVGTHLDWRLEAMIQSGALPPGQRLPSVRELAARTSVNVNTARSVYDRLEEGGLAYARHGAGTFVAPRVPLNPTLEQLAAEVARSAIAQGIDPRELARAIYTSSPPDLLEDDYLAGLLEGEPLTEAERRSARSALGGQIARLEAELAAYPEPIAKRPMPSRHPGAHIPDVDELEATRDELVGRLKKARAAASKRGEEQSMARQQLERMAADPAAHKWESISREQTGEPGCGHTRVRPAWGPIGALMNWWRVKVSSGCPLVVPPRAR